MILRIQGVIIVINDHGVLDDDERFPGIKYMSGLVVEAFYRPMKMRS